MVSGLWLTKLEFSCANCHKKETNDTALVNWLILGTLRDVIKPLSNGDGTYWKKDFCSRECLIEFAGREKWITGETDNVNA